MIKILSIVLFIIIPIKAYADQITADRPGIGADPEVVPQWTLQPELGTDSKEIRFGILNGLEIDKDDTSWGEKYGFIRNDKLKASFKLSYDSSLKTVGEIPLNYTLSSWFNLGTDVIISKHSRSYAAEFGFTPTGRLSITPTVYYDDKVKTGLFLAWIPKGHDNTQLDAGISDGKFSIGISTAIDFTSSFKKKR